MRRKTIQFLGLLFLASLIGCDDNKTGDEANKPHDPSKPIEFTSFMPESGRIAETMIIKGNNFGNDKSKVQVLFKDNNEKEVSAVVVGVDNQTIYCMVPRQSTGENEVIVSVDDNRVTADKTFGYTMSENVSTIAGNKDEKDHVDGNLSVARFKMMAGIAIVGDETFLVAQTYEANGVRLVSVPDNEVVTVHPGADIGQLIATKDKSTVYGITRLSPYTLYKYEKSSAWAPARMAEIGNVVARDNLWTCALDDTEEWLYFIPAGNGNLCRINLIDTSVVEVVKEACLPGDFMIHMTYSRHEDCFYATVQSQRKLYRISKDGQEVTLLNAITTIAGCKDGYLDEATFNDTAGLIVDEDGNVYFVQTESRVLRKLTVNTGYVETVAGSDRKDGADDGVPDEATFGKLINLCYDGEGGFYLVSGWNSNAMIRKYAIE